MSTLSDRLRDATRDIVTGERLLPGLFGHSPIEDLEAAADELDRLTAELDQHKKSAAFCEKHQPSGGQRGMCLVCAGRNLSAALSRISYLCGPPNEMECGPYDVHCDETAVVAQVERLTARVAELAKEEARLARFEEWLADRSGPVLHIDSIRDALEAEHG